MACGRYEGIDARVAEHYRTRLPVLEVSLADVVFAGGEVVALALVEAVARLLPGVLGNESSAVDDSFAPDRDPEAGALEAPVSPDLRSGAGWRCPRSRDPAITGDSRLAGGAVEGAHRRGAPRPGRRRINLATDPHIRSVSEDLDGPGT